MTDELTARMHSAGDNTTFTLIPPAQVRESAERRRRMRRMTGAVCAAVFVVLIGTGLLVGNMQSAQTTPPANPPAPPTVNPGVLPTRTPPVRPAFYELMIGRDQNVVIVLESSLPADMFTARLERAFETAIPTERGRCQESTGNCYSPSPQLDAYQLAADPTLTSGDLAYFAGLSSSTPTWTAISGNAEGLPTLTTCFSGSAGLSVNRAHLAAFRTVSGLHPGLDVREAITPTHPAFLIETVLQFDDESAAADAYRSIRSQARSCDYSISQMWADGPNSVSGWPVDELFIAELQPST